MKGYEFIAQMLKEYGVTHLFYVEAILRRMTRAACDLGIKRVMTHSENAAGYMADGYARTSGKPGVCMAQSVGAGNMVGGIMDANYACSPVISITGKKAPYFRQRAAYQESNHISLYDGITKYNADIIGGEELPVLLRQAFREAVSAKPGPVHIDVSDNTGETIEQAEVAASVAAQSAFTTYPPFRPLADEASIKQAAEEIRAAKKPIIVAGRGALYSQAQEELFAFAKKADIPLAITPDGKTVIDENDDLYVGVVGLYGMPCANMAVSQADLVIYVGSRASDQTTCNWTIPSSMTRIVQVDIDAAEIGRNYPNVLGLHGDAKMVLGQLTKAIATMEHESWCKEVHDCVAAVFAEYEQRAQQEGTLVNQSKLCLELAKALPEDAILVSDTGFSAIWTSNMVKMKPSQKYLRAAGSLGWAFPASLGAKCAAPDRPVICFTGDGGFYYHMCEMETAVRNGINTVVLVNNNSGLNQCTGVLGRVYEDDPKRFKESFEFAPTNFAKIAEDMGLWARRVERVEEVGRAIADAIASGRPAVVEVISDRSKPLAATDMCRICQNDCKR